MGGCLIWHIHDDDIYIYIYITICDAFIFYIVMGCICYDQIDGLVQDYSNSSALAMELLQ